jgi:hypothetical protein
MAQLKAVDFLGAITGILVIGLGIGFVDAPDASPEWWAAFGKLYLISLVPFCLSCWMIGRRAERSSVTMLWGVLAAFGVFILTVDVLQKRPA